MAETTRGPDQESKEGNGAVTHVVVLLPGIMGSVLELGNEVVWPGSVGNLLWSEYKQMDKLLKPELKATDVIRSFSISEQYGSLIRDLGTCGFHEAGPKPTLFVCPYDWRKDNALAAGVLADKVDAAVAMHGADTEVSIVAHSMGGLVARCPPCQYR